MTTDAQSQVDIRTDPVLTQFRAALDRIYGARLERVVLYGSRARGDARPDSDWDVAVFLHDSEGLWRESKRLSPIETDILLRTGELVVTLPFPAGAYAQRTPLMHELRREGIDL
jgi:predicted nucleotidyltransferase